jgi:hypothetical protein
MSGYRVKQALFIVLGFIVGAIVCSNSKELFQANLTHTFVDYAFVCGIGMAMGALLAFITGGSNDK